MLSHARHLLGVNGLIEVDDPSEAAHRVKGIAAATTRPALIRVARQAFDVGEALDWKSYDPYDILLSPLATLVRDRSPLLARILLQLGRRSGPRARRLLRIPPHEEPKALADFVQAAVMLARSGEEWASPYVRTLSERLLEQAAITSAGYGWGLQFPWVSRFGSIAAGEPNIYTTTAACRAFLDEYELERRPASLETAIGGMRFILDGLGSLTHGGRPWLRYTARWASPIVNVQASSASLFARVFEYYSEDVVLEAADRAAEAVVTSQRPDGSWAYSADGRGAFVDGFHSGFTLQGLHEYVARRDERAVPGTVAAIEAGLAYFKEHLLTPDGLPRGFTDGRVSLDGQNLAQSIQTLLVCGDDADAATATRIWQVGLPGLQLERSARPALRWSVGPFVLSTAFLLQAIDAVREGSGSTLPGR
jgi:hypothetical protein